MSCRWLCVIFLALIYAENDVEGSRDHPLVSRYNGSVIRKHSESEFETCQLRVGPVDSFIKPAGETKNVEGRLTRINYLAPEGRSSTEVFRNYQKALLDAGMETIWQCENRGCGQGIAQAVLTRDFATEVKWMGFNYDDQFYITGRLRMNDREYYVSVLTVGAYSIGGPLKGRVFTQLDVVESKGMQEGMVTLSSDKLLTAVENEGRVAVYGIHFEFDKAIVKPESYPQLDEIAKMLNKTDGQFLVVGHTDNKGDLEYNQRLSYSRAESVIRALSERGVSSARLIPIGVGMASPVASNTTEEGRAKNRRVEIVKR